MGLWVAHVEYAGETLADSEGSDLHVPVSL
jgi:hypothetical protein